MTLPHPFTSSNLTLVSNVIYEFNSLALLCRLDQLSNMGCSGCVGTGGMYCRKCFGGKNDVAGFCQETEGMAEERCVVKFCKGVK